MVRRRITALFLIMGCISFLLTFRLVWIQFIRSEYYQEEALKQRMREVQVEPKRGIIFDRNKKELAVSASADSVFAVPAEIKNAHKTAEALAEVVDMEVVYLETLLSKKQSFVWIKRKIDDKNSQKIRSLDLDGIGLTEESKRFYPNGTLAAQILGFAGIDSQGLDGLELYYDQYLRGAPGWIVAERDATGRKIPQGEQKYLPPKNGNDVILTIDEVIQYITERELSKAMQETQAKSGTAIVMDPKTGGILALANYPTYDPNHFGKYPQTSWRNASISNSYEPGSTFKTITAAAALEEGKTTINDHFFCSGSIKVGPDRIKCSHTEGHGSQSFADIVKNSCNPGFVTVGQRLGKDVFGKYIKAFGFGEKTGIDLPGEAKGIVRPPEQLRPIDVATNSIGQGIAVTPIQLAVAVSAVANNGKLMQPHLLKEVRSPDEKVIKKVTPTIVRQVISQETAKTLCETLAGVVTKNGTGRNAVIEGYKIAGKTGTAQKPGPHGGYAPGKYVGSFVGFVPADDPRLTVLVSIDEPKGAYYGGTVAAPVVREIMRDSLQYLGIPPSEPIDNDKGQNNTGESSQYLEESLNRTIHVPPLTDLSIVEARQMAKLLGLKVQIMGEGSKVVNQIPKANVRVVPDTTIILYLGDEQKNMAQGNTDQKGKMEVPDVTGKTIRDVAEIISYESMDINIHGSGIAVRQKPHAGEKVNQGTLVEVWFEPPSVHE